MKRYTSLQSIQADLQAGQLTCRTLVEYYLQNIEKLNGQLNAFLSVYDQEALQKANEIDQKIANGTAGKLAGMVVGIKDLLCYKDHPSQGGSRILTGFKSQFTATAVQRIIDADAIIIGRQNCDEFGMGSSNENSAFGPAFNAADLSRVAGGSSGGSAVAVQADFCLASLGTDTGGSIRLPASFCGVLGLKPTYSRVSRWGLKAYGSSFDTIGPITHSAEDAALLLEVIAGADEFDSTVSQREVPSYINLLENNNKRWKIAYIRDALDEGLQPEVREQTYTALKRLEEAGHTVEAIDFPLIKYFLPTYYILTTAEVSSNLSRLDGVKYGYRSTESVDLESLYKKSRSEGFGDEAKRRIMLGTFVLSASYYDAYYTKAQRVRRLIKEQTEQILTEYDFLVSPACATTAFKVGAKSEDPLQMYLTDLFTVQANVVGLPAISIPNGTDQQGLPIGFQAMAGAFREADLLQLAQQLMK
ncbi:MAG: Asp-tRNA(Asn)/Glu-tRNA(Gln) amidotransferase subunit GatA [Spirosomataceae bacterium]